MDEGAILSSLDRGALHEALTLTLKTYGAEVLAYLGRVLRNEEDAREVFCDLGGELWLALPTFRRACSVRTFVYRIAWHAVARYRRDPYRRRAEPLEGTAAAIAAEVASRTAPYLRSEVRRAVERLRAELSPEDQTLLTLRIDRRMSWAELAVVLDATEPTARKRFERVKARLREAAQREGLLVDG